jgi:hypothetical protein
MRIGFFLAMDPEPLSRGALRRSPHWHRWFAWRPAIVRNRAGDPRVVWLRYVERRWTEGITRRLGTTMGLSQNSDYRELNLSRL